MKEYIVILFLLKISFILSYVTIPFSYNIYNLKDIVNQKEISGKELHKYLYSKLKTYTPIGNQDQKLLSYITMESWMFYLSKYSCNEEDIKTESSTYTPENSKTYSNSTFTSYAFRDIRNATIGQDTFNLYDNIDLTNSISLKNFQFIYGDKFNYNTQINSNICGVIGLNIPRYFLEEYKNNYFLKELNNKDIGKYAFSFDFKHVSNKNNDGLLVIGVEEDKYLNLFNVNNITEIEYEYASSVEGSSVAWALFNSGIFFKYKNTTNNTIETIKITDQIYLILNIDANYIFIPKKLYNLIKENFFNSYINQNICHEVETTNPAYRYKFIYCDKKTFKDKKNLISIYIYFVTQPVNLTLTNNDLFSEVDDKYIFLGFYDFYNADMFIVGKLFFKKYQYIFNIDKKQLGLLGNYSNEDEIIDDENKNSSSNSNLIKYILIVIGLIIFISGIGFGIYIGKKFCLNRKKRANELLDDDFEYSASKENGVVNNENKIIN